MLEDTRKKWDKRFSNKAHIAPAPPASVNFMQPFLKPGALLDIACGDGAMALHFARCGWRVTGLDTSAVALERLQSFANSEGIEINTWHCDLDELTEHDRTSPTHRYDNIVISRFKPDEKQWPAIIQLLNDNGILCISTFNERQHSEHGFPMRFCLESNELISLKGLKLVAQQRVNNEGDHFDHYCFQKLPV